jgi:hypothetical protein
VAPGLKTLPGAPVETEQVDGKDAAPCRKGLEARARKGEAAFLQHPPRTRVDHPGGGGQFPVGRIGEEGVEHRARGLRGVTMAPMRDAEPVAQARRAVPRIRPDADHADEAVRPGAGRDRHREAGAFGVLAAGPQDEIIHGGGRQRMRDARRHLRDRFLPGQTQYGLGVGLPGPAQPEPAGFEAEDVVAGKVGKHVALRSGVRRSDGRRTLPCRRCGIARPNDEGEVASHLPFLDRAWLF